MKKWTAWILFFPWILFFGLPVFSLFFGQGLGTSSDHTSWVSDFFDPILLHKVKFTVTLSAAVSVVSVFIGIPLGFVLRHSPRSALWLKAPFGIPTLVAASAWVSILSETPILYSVWGVFLAQLVFNIPWVAFSVAQASSQISRSMDELARSLGAKRFQRWFQVYFPAVGPALLASGAQVFLFCSMSFALVMLLGGGPPVETLETAIYSSVRSGSVDFNSARVLAVWQFALALVPAIIVLVLKPRVSRGLEWNAADSRAISEPILHRFLGLVWVFPYLLFLKDLQWEVFWNPQFWHSIRDPFILSVVIAFMVAALSLVWTTFLILGLRSLVSSRIRSILEAVILVPSGTSSLTLGLAFWIAYSTWVDPFEGSLLAVTLIQSFIFFPIVFRWISPLIGDQVDARYELALSLGASPFRAWREVEWPRLKGPVAHSYFLICAASFGELAIMSFFSSGSLVTLPLMISRWMVQYRFEYANAASALLFLGAVVLARGWRRERAWFNHQMN